MSQASKDGLLKCPICGLNTSDVSQLRRHFPKCVKKHGNPGGLNWDDDSSCGFDNIVVSRMGHAATKRLSRERIESRKA